MMKHSEHTVQIQNITEALIQTLCDECLNDLPAYIERELEGGEESAKQTYPDVAWCLAKSQDYRETYHITRAFVQAEQHGELHPFRDLITLEPGDIAMVIHPVFPEPSPLLRPTGNPYEIVLSRDFLNEVLFPTLNLDSFVCGVTRGDESDEMVLIEEETSDHYCVTLSVRSLNDTMWNVVVEIIPPIEGDVSLNLGDRVFPAYFVAPGKAVVSNIPSSLLTAADGPACRVILNTRV
jgi:hypothetical protein